MTRKQILLVAIGALLLAAPATVAGAGQVGEHQERKIALSEVPPAAMDGAKTMLTSISRAELVTTKDGRTLYEIKGRNDLGKLVELFVTADGQVLGTELEDEHKP